jgi:hypothetical protein
MVPNGISPRFAGVVSSPSKFNFSVSVVVRERSGRDNVVAVAAEAALQELSAQE